MSKSIPSVWRESELMSFLSLSLSCCFPSKSLDLRNEDGVEVPGVDCFWRNNEGRMTEEKWVINCFPLMFWSSNYGKTFYSMNQGLIITGTKGDYNYNYCSNTTRKWNGKTKSRHTLIISFDSHWWALIFLWKLCEREENCNSVATNTTCRRKRNWDKARKI